MGKPGSQTKKMSGRVKNAENMAKVMQLRRAGIPLRRVAEQLGISITSVFLLEQKALEDYRISTQEEIDAQRAMITARLEWMTQSLSAKVGAGQVTAVNALRQVIDTFCKLHGLNAPVKIAPTSPDGAEEWSGSGLAALLREGE